VASAGTIFRVLHRDDEMRFLLPAAIAIGLTAAAAITLARGAEVSAGEVEVTAAWARATPPGAEIGAAYVTIANRGGFEDRLLGAATPAARSVTIHQSLEESGVATMRPVDAPRIPVGGALEMQPGGTHLMLMGLSAPLRQGEVIPVTLRFERAGDVTLQVPIASIGATTPPEEHHVHGM
jgi:copper(I)-binding protein